MDWQAAVDDGDGRASGRDGMAAAMAGEKKRERGREEKERRRREKTKDLLSSEGGTRASSSHQRHLGQQRAKAWGYDEP